MIRGESRRRIREGGDEMERKKTRRKNEKEKEEERV